MGTFVAALLALLVAWLTHFVAEDYRRHLKGTNIASLLLGELTSHKAAYEMQREIVPIMLEAAKAGSLQRLPRAKLPDDLALAAVLPDVGLLGPDICCDIAYVYHNIRAFRSAFQTVLDDQDNMTSDAVHGTLEAAYQAQDRAKERGEKLIGLLATRVGQPWWIRSDFPHVSMK